MKSNNNRAVAINSQKLDELYKEWSGEHHTTNSNKPVHDSAECCDFAEYCLKYGMEERKAKANAKNSVLHIFSVVPSFLKVFVEILGYCAFAYIVCFLIFGGEFHIEIYFKESIEALKNILN